MIKTNTTTIILDLSANIIDKVNPFIASINEYSNIIQVIAPFPREDSVSMNFTLRNAKITDYTQYMRLKKNNEGQPLLGKDVLDPKNSYYQTVKDWNVWEMPISSKATRAISRFHTGKVGLSFSFKEFLNLYPEEALNDKGTFGSNQSSLGGDLPQTATNGDFYRCDYLNYHSSVANEDFTLNDIAYYDNGWKKSGVYEYRVSSATTTLSVDPSIFGANIEDIDPSMTDIAMSRISTLESMILKELPAESLANDFIRRDLDLNYPAIDNSLITDRLFVQRGSESKHTTVDKLMRSLDTVRLNNIETFGGSIKLSDSGFILGSKVNDGLDWDGNTLRFRGIIDKAVINDPDLLEELRGPKGEPGEPGETGASGTSFNFMGIVQYVSDLDDVINPKQNDAYRVEDTGELYVFDGNGWVNMGLIQGPAGDPGDAPDYVELSGKQVFKYLDSETIPVETSIILTAELFGDDLYNYKWQYFNGGQWTDLAGANTNKTYTLQYNNPAFTSTELRVRCISDKDKFDEMTIIKIYDGESALSGYLTNENISVPANQAGDVYELYNANGSFIVFKGLSNVSNATTFDIEGEQSITKNGLTMTHRGYGEYELTGDEWTTSYESFTMNATFDGLTISKLFTISKANQGSQGTPGRDGSNAKYVVVNGDLSFKYPKDSSTPVKRNIVLTADLYGGLSTRAWQYEKEGEWYPLDGDNTLYSYSLNHEAIEFMGTDQVSIRCLSEEGYYDEVTIVKLYDGDDALSGYLTNEDETLPSDPDGNNTDLEGSGGTFKMFKGITDVSSLSDYSIEGGVNYSAYYEKKQNGLALQINKASGVYTLIDNGWSSDRESFTLQATHISSTISKTYTVIKSRTGTPGLNASYITVTGEMAFKYLAGIETPTFLTIDLKATLYGNATTYNWQYWSGEAWTTLNNNTDTYTLEHDSVIWNGKQTVRLRCLSDDGLYDEHTVVKVQDGTPGSSGVDGNDGADGLDGKDGIDGKDGKDALPVHVYWAYANSIEGLDFSIQPFEGATHMGTYSTTDTTQSTSPTSYTWSKFKGDRGEDGPAGDSVNFRGRVPGLGYLPSGALKGDVWIVESNGNGYVSDGKGGWTNLGKFQGSDGADGLDGKDGNDGLDGNDGKGAIQHTAYADTPDGSGGTFSITPFENAIYMGSYWDTTVEDSLDPNDYQWVRIRGEDGVSPRPNNTYWAYADTANGQGSTFSMEYYTDALYVGRYDSRSTTQSNNPADYVWARLKGDTGPEGPTGTSVRLKGTVDTVGDLPTGATSGDLYIVAGGDGYVSDGEGNWKNVGPIRGPKGTDGEDGIDGSDGRDIKRHVAYANTPDGSGTTFSITYFAGAIFEGEYYDYDSNVDSTDHRDYHWKRIKGEDGKDGKDGVPVNIYWAYANTSDGSGPTFNTTYFENAEYMGRYETTSLTQSETYTDYQWMKLRGDTGETGPTGVSSIIKGTVAGIGNLPLYVDKGDIYIVSNQGGHGYMSDGEGNWSDVGPIRGQDGADGKDGNDGADGNDGLSSYTHYAYADTPDGSGPTFSITSYPNAIYRGVYTDFTEVDSSDHTDYAWVKWRGDKGDDGLDGNDGADGDDGLDAIVWDLSTHSLIFPTNSDGNGYDVSGWTGQFRVQDGLSNVTTQATFTINQKTKNGLTLSIGSNTGVMKLTTPGDLWTSKEEIFDVQATYKGMSVTKQLTVTKNLQGIKGDKGDTGPTGPGILYRGVHKTTNYYYADKDRRDVVKKGNNYYVLKVAASPNTGGFIITNWELMSSFSSVATDLLLAQDATITKGLVMGSASEGGFIRSYGMSGLNTGNGFYMDGKTGEFTFGNADTSYIKWDGTNLTFEKPFDVFEWTSRKADNINLRIRNNTSTGRRFWYKLDSVSSWTLGPYISAYSTDNFYISDLNMASTYTVEVRMGSDLSTVQRYVAETATSDILIGTDARAGWSVSGGSIGHLTVHKVASDGKIHHTITGTMTIDSNTGTCTVYMGTSLLARYTVLANTSSSDSSGSGMQGVYTRYINSSSFSITNDYTGMSNTNQVVFMVSGWRWA